MSTTAFTVRPTTPAPATFTTPTYTLAQLRAAARELFGLASCIRIAQDVDIVSAFMTASNRREDLYRVLCDSDPLDVDAVLKEIVVG